MSSRRGQFLLPKVLCRTTKDNKRISPISSAACGTLGSSQQLRQPFGCCLSPPAFPFAEHLRTSVSDRMKLIAQKAKARLQDSDDISQLDIQLKINDFISRMQMTLGEPFPPPIQEKLFMLQELFFIVTAA